MVSLIMQMLFFYALIIQITLLVNIRWLAHCLSDQSCNFLSSSHTDDFCGQIESSQYILVYIYAVIFLLDNNWIQFALQHMHASRKMSISSSIKLLLPTLCNSHFVVSYQVLFTSKMSVTLPYLSYWAPGAISIQRLRSVY